MPIREIKVKELRGARFGLAAAEPATRAAGCQRPVVQRLLRAQRAGACAGAGHTSGSSSCRPASEQQLKEQVASALVATGPSDSPYLMNQSGLGSGAVCPTNVIMQPIREQKLQSRNGDAQTQCDNDDNENNPSEQKKTNPLAKRANAGRELKLVVRAAAASRCDQPSRCVRASKFASPPLLATLISAYCFLAACASVARCAPTGSSSHNQRANTAHYERRQVAPAEVVRVLQLTGAPMQAVAGSGKIGGDLIGALQPIAVLNVYNNNINRHQHHPKSSSEQEQRDEANISMEPSEAASLVRRPDRKAEDDEEERQMLLVLAGDTSDSPSSLRRLIKRSGISDQRLAEIQMIRALKKQLERAATKIAADSTGGGGDGGQGTAAT